MKRPALIIMCLAAAAMMATSLAEGRSVAQPDLSLRAAIYFTGKKADKIDLKSDKYVAQGGSITIKKSEAIKCEGNRCTFNLGILVFRDSDVGRLSTYAQIKNLGVIETGNTVFFQEGEKIKQAIYPVTLVVGYNRLTAQVDPANKVAESNEGNNLVEHIRVLVEP